MYLKKDSPGFFLIDRQARLICIQRSLFNLLIVSEYTAFAYNNNHGPSKLIRVKSGWNIQSRKI